MAVKSIIFLRSGSAWKRWDFSDAEIRNHFRLKCILFFYDLRVTSSIQQSIVPQPHILTMRKYLQNTIVRTICVLLLGGMLIGFSKDMSKWMVMISGLFFIIPSSISLTRYFLHEKSKGQSWIYALLASGSLLFGLTQLILPEIFEEVLRYILAAALFIAASTQFFIFWNLRRSGVNINGWWTTIPLMEWLISLFIAIYHDIHLQQHQTMQILGVGFILYAFMEILTILHCQKPTNTPKDQLIENDNRNHKK